MFKQPSVMSLPSRPMKLFFEHMFSIDLTYT